MTNTPMTPDRDYPICTQEAARAAGLDVAPSPAELRAVSETVVSLWGDRWAEPEDTVASIADSGAQLARVMPLVLAEVDRLRKALSDSADQVAERDNELGGVHAELDRLRREIQHHKDGKARWRSRAEKAEARVAELAGRPAEAHVLRQAAAQVEDEHPEAAAALHKAANVAEHAAAQRPWQDAEHAEGQAQLDAMRWDHPAPCRVPDSPDSTCPEVSP